MSLNRLEDEVSLPLLDNKYRLLRVIGRGAVGAVYEAEHQQLGRRCAIKVLSREVASERARLRFEREARLLALLDHENIVSLLDMGNDATKGQFLVLEYIRGSTLRSELARSSGAVHPQLLEILKQLARGLGHAHAAGIVHRDLKPENVMLTTHADGRLLVKILDFGIARLFAEDADHITSTGIAAGTAAYMAPEQARGERDVDARVDVYALGVIVYEALAGTRPYDGSSYNELIFQILSKDHILLQERRADLPKALCSVVERALSKDKLARFDTVEEFAAAFDSAARAALIYNEQLETDDSPIQTGAFFSSGVQLARQNDSPAQRGSVFSTAGAKGAAIGIVTGLVIGAGFYPLLLAGRQRNETENDATLSTAARLAASEPLSNAALLATQDGRAESAGELDHPKLGAGGVPTVSKLEAHRTSQQRPRRATLASVPSSKPAPPAASADPLEKRGYVLDSPYRE